MKQKTNFFLEGVVKMRSGGFGFLIPDDLSYPDVYIPMGKTGSALNNDRVRVKVYQKKRKGPKSLYGSVHSILKRDREFAVGFFERKGKKGFLKNHNLSCPEALLLENPDKIPVRDGECVRVKIISYAENGEGAFRADLTENLGPIELSAKDDIKRVMAEKDIPFHWPEEVLKELALLPDHPLEKDFSNRRDLREKPFCTIDGPDAQDFDDAILVEKLGKGLFRLYVAIADVGHYVPEGGSLDREALQRGNSSYFPGFCSPMLPEKLSQGLCSLNPGVPRLVMVQEMDLNLKGDRVREELYPAVIQSQRRLNYQEAQALLDKAGSNSSTGKASAFSLKEAGELARILLHRHTLDQALILDIPETSILLDKKGETKNILQEERLFSHQMIEQFMLAANKAVSAFLERRQTPFMYRIHEEPDREKLKALEKFSAALGWPKSLSSRKDLIGFLAKYRDHKCSALIHKLVLRSMAQARYSTVNKGHYGLNFSSYTHFTSPIRRYCDLLAHRAIRQALKPHQLKGGAFLPLGEIEARAQKISQREQNSVLAERQIKDIKKARFLQKHLGESFEAWVSTISSFGLFITLKDVAVEGLVRFRDLRGFWELDEFQLSAFNKKSSYKIQFGDEVKILVSACSPLRGRVEFKLLSHKGKDFSQYESDSKSQLKEERPKDRRSKGKAKEELKKNKRSKGRKAKEGPKRRRRKKQRNKQGNKQGSKQGSKQHT